MTGVDAQRIVDSWAFYLEHWQDKIFVLFGGDAPRSLLPAPIEAIEEAVNVIAERYHYQRDFEAVELLHRSLSWLAGYCDDEEALIRAAKSYSHPDIRSVIVSQLVQFPSIRANAGR